jgi:cbb3-type cytochrome oxidase subunit 3
LRLEARLSTLDATMGKVSQTIKGYIWWMYRRGSVHYDVMVTLILAFIFLAPIWINFRDKPRERSPNQTELVVKSEGTGFLYTVNARTIQPGSDDEVRDELSRAIEPVAGEIRIDRYEVVRDDKRNIIAYKVWGHR